MRLFTLKAYCLYTFTYEEAFLKETTGLFVAGKTSKWANLISLSFPISWVIYYDAGV